ncbi:MAG: hypothetical protein LC746_13600 [Acidobacteria bacterium]|nr:hypothetical protein [Acidobacteriota bacterium]
MRRPSVSLLASIFFAACLCASAALAQSATPTQPAQPAQTPPPAQAATAPQTPAANPADVDTIDHILAALYDVISGPAGKKRDWDRMRSLFIPGARLIPTSSRRAPGTPPDAPLTGKEEYAARVLSPEDYIARSAPFLEGNGFFERESARRTEQYGHIAHVFSTYESRHKAEDAKPFQRGINSIQLVNDGRRWWVVTIFWEGETNVTPLPDKYLKSAP